MRETRAISDLLSPSSFFQSQIFPFSYQNVVVRGNATKIDSLLLREYLRQEYSIPKLKEGTEVAGGYTDIFKTGVVKNVLHCDVQSLYPSIMMAYGIFPECDELRIFGTLLRDLVRFRLEAKEQERRARDAGMRGHYRALQTTFKIVINSFYGYLGHAFSHFADFEQAAAVTEKGREILRTMIGWLREQGCEIVEIDGSYAAMFSYKIKNYALLDSSGRLTIKGSGLRSRGIEKYLRDFLRELILLTLREEYSKAPQLLEDRRAQTVRQRVYEDRNAAGSPGNLPAESQRGEEKPQCSLRAGPGVRPSLPGRGSNLLLCNRGLSEGDRLQQFQARSGVEPRTSG